MQARRKAASGDDQRADVISVVQAGPHRAAYADARAQERERSARRSGLGVSHYVGSLIEVEAVAFPAPATAQRGRFASTKRRARWRATACSTRHQSCARIIGIDPLDHDLHVNVIGGGNIDGPSAGLAIFLALFSALTRTRLPQDVAITGELSISAGNVRPSAASSRSSMRRGKPACALVLMPKENEREVERAFDPLEIEPVGRSTRRSRRSASRAKPKR